MTKGKTILAGILILFSAIAKGQGVDSLFVDVRGSFLQQAGNGSYSSSLNAEYLNIHMWGRISDNLSYRIRQRLNVAIDTENPFRATDWMVLYWKVNDRLKLYGGKTAIMIGGYEYDAAPIDVYFYSRFCNNLNQCFAFSVGGEYEIAPGQALAVQIANSPLTSGFNDMYSYNLAWIGRIAPWCHTIWSCNLVDDQYGRKINYLALGNHCVWEGLLLDVDLINRASFSQSRFLLSDYSVISKLIWNIGKWNICGKVGYEFNDKSNVDAGGLAFDNVIVPGTDYLYWGYGVEYMPLGNDRLRLHVAGFTDNATRAHTISAGLKWRFDIL